MIALVASLTLAGAVSPARTLDVVFVPDSLEAPVLVIAADNAGDRRSFDWALLPPDSSSEAASAPTLGGALSDQAGGPGYLPLPSAPQGAVIVERDGALSITIDEAGAWQDSWRKLVPAKGAAPLPVSSARALRLVVYSGPEGGASSAVLYGDALRIAGRAFTFDDRQELRAVVRGPPSSRGGQPLLVAALATALDRVAGCGGEVASAAYLSSGALEVKLYARSAPVCAGALAVVPVEGMSLEARAGGLVRGVLVQHR